VGLPTVSAPSETPTALAEDASPAPTGGWSRPLLALAKLALSGGLLAFVLRGTSLDALWQTFRQVRPAWVAAAMSMHGLMVAVSVWRWRLLLDAQQIRVPVRALTESFWVALFFNNFLPSNIGGDVVRIADTARPAGSKTLATTIVLVDRVLGLLALLSVGALGAMGARSLGVDIPGTIWIEVGALAALGLCVLLFFTPTLRNLAFKPLHAVGHPWIAERVAVLQETLDRFGRRPTALAGALAGAVIVPLVMAGVLVPVALVLQMMPVSINGFGVREAVFSFFFVRFGLGVEAAVAVSLLGTALIMLFSLGGGALFLLRRH
jgi:uncharacterized membrane protein YbhN (UPF0104 family)